MSDPFQTAIDREIFADDVERFVQIIGEWFPDGLGDPCEAMPGLFHCHQRHQYDAARPWITGPNAAYLEARSKLRNPETKP